MSKQQIGVVGMAVMGRNLALNIERALLNKSFRVSLPRSGLCFQAIRTLSGIPAFVILFSARTRGHSLRNLTIVVTQRQ